MAVWITGDQTYRPEYTDIGRCFAEDTPTGAPNNTLTDEFQDQWYGTYEEAVAKCDGLTECRLIHDWFCDGQYFKVCQSAEWRNLNKGGRCWNML